MSWFVHIHSLERVTFIKAANNWARCEVSRVQRGHETMPHDLGRHLADAFTACSKIFWSVGLCAAYELGDTLSKDNQDNPRWRWRSDPTRELFGTIITERRLHRFFIARRFCAKINQGCPVPPLCASCDML